MSFGHFCGRLSDAKCVISHFLARENVLCAPLNKKKKKRHKFAVLANSPECLVAFIIFTHFPPGPYRGPPQSSRVEKVGETKCQFVVRKMYLVFRGAG
jgi:hypothetical protein